MSHPKIGSTTVTVDTRRLRQTSRPQSSFTQVLEGGANVLLSGAAVATRAVGLPMVSAAISRARIGADAAITTGGNASIGSAGGGLSSVADLQKQRMDDDLKLLALQSRIQQHNRQVSLVSNVMKARHDTAKAAIANMRS